MLKMEGAGVQCVTLKSVSPLRTERFFVIQASVQFKITYINGMF
jgi:hypothetical protein